jgi:MFS family permease
MQERVVLSKGFYLGSILGGFLLFFILYFVGIATMVASEEPFPGVFFVLLGFTAIIYAVVILSIFVYKMWKAIQDGYARTTPGKAVGFLFIPFFNIYWIFQAYWGFSVDYNTYIERHSIAANRLPAGLFLTYAILSAASAVPYIGMLPGIAATIILMILIVQICNAVNALPDMTPTESVPPTEAGAM